MDDLVDLKGRTALVTGAGQGVGLQVATDLALHNAGLILVNDFYAERADAAASEVERAGGTARPVRFDVGDFDAVTAGIAGALDRNRTIEILVNNAGNAGPTTSINDSRRFWETRPSDWNEWLAPNFYGVLNCTHAVVTGMVDRGYGRIVTVVSDAGRAGEPNLIVYSAAKAGSAGFIRALARSVGAFGVTANCVSLSAIRTPATRETVDDEQVVKRMLNRYAIRRLGEPKDASAIILFLASDAAEWITGQTYSVNGGYLMPS